MTPEEKQAVFYVICSIQMMSALTFVGAFSILRKSSSIWTIIKGLTNKQKNTTIKTNIAKSKECSDDKAKNRKINSDAEYEVMRRKVQTIFVFYLCI